MTTKLQNQRSDSAGQVGGQKQGAVLLLAPQGHPLFELGAAIAGGNHTLVAADSIEDAGGAGAALAVVHPSLADPARLGDLAAVRVLLTDDEAGAAAEEEGYFDFVLSLAAVREQWPGLFKVGARVQAAKESFRKLRQEQQGSAREFSGCSAATRRINTALRRAADSEATILVEGRAGTGKTTAARWIHLGGRRCNQHPVVVEAVELDEESLARVLTEARDTTLVIEEVEGLPSKSQSLLVRHLKERPAAGGGFARIVATTSARLPELVARGQFREDLFYRLNMFPVVMPMLRERREDIAQLARELCDRGGGTGAGAPVAFTPAAMILLESHPWDGNVAQLAHVLERALSLAGDGPIDRMHLLGPSTGLSTNFDNPMATPRETDESDELREEDIRPLQEEEERLLSRALKATRGNVRRAAQLLGIGRATLYRKIQVYDLKLT